MRTFKYNPKGSKLNFIPIGDVHWGAKECDEELFTDYLKWIRKEPDTVALLMGDLIDSSLKSSPGSSMYESKMNVDDQYDAMTDMLQPIRNKLVGLIEGNHEERVYRETGFNISKVMARELGVPYFGHSELFRVKVGKQRYDFFVTHGSSGSTTPTGRLNSLLKISAHFKADIYCMGHVHDLFTMTDLTQSFGGERK